MSFLLPSFSLAACKFSEQERNRQQQLLASLEQEQVKTKQPLLLTFVEKPSINNEFDDIIDNFDFDFSGGFEDSDFDNSHANDQIENTEQPTKPQNDNNIAHLVFRQPQELLTFEDRLAQRYQKEAQRAHEQRQLQNNEENNEHNNNRVTATQQPQENPKDRRTIQAGKRKIVRARKAANKPQPRRSPRANKGVRGERHGDKLYETELNQRGL